MKGKIQLLSCLFICSIVFSCKKDDASEPDVSPNGEYFNCKIDGKYWTFKQGDGLFGSDALYARFEVVDRPHYEIKAGSDDYPQTQFTFTLDTADMSRTDTIAFTLTSRSYVQLYSPYPFEVGVNPEFESFEGRVIFTNRSATNVQGIFDFEANNGTTIAKITDGKFKINL